MTAGPIPAVHAAEVREHTLRPSGGVVGGADVEVSAAAASSMATGAGPAGTPVGDPPEILVYLQSALNGGQTPQAVGAQLQQAVAMGMVPQAMLDEIRSLSVDEVVGQYTRAAEQFGIEDLTTPGAENFLRDLYGILVR